MEESGLPLPLALLILFGSAKIIGELFERMGQPGIVGEIVAGALVGPSLLGWVHPNEALTALSELGVMFLLFGVGLEVHPEELLKVGPTATVVAILGVIVPFVAGWAIFTGTGSPPAEAIFVGAALVATSVGITASVLAARGLLQEVASKIILAAAVIDDVLGLIVLAVVSSVAQGEVNVLDIALTATLAITFTVVVVKWGAKAVGRVIPHIDQKGLAPESQFHGALVLLFGLAALATSSGVAAIIGAFLAGLALSQSVTHRVHDLTKGVNELLVPFFLAGIGLNLDVSMFTSGPTLILALGLTAAAVVTKLVGCGLGAVRLGKSNMLKIGMGMVPRGEVGMVVAQMGLSMAVISQETYAVVVFMAVMTTLVTPVLLKFAFTDPPKGQKASA